MGALGLIQGKLPAKGLEKGRDHILDLLADKFGDDSHIVLVIFDAARSPRRFLHAVIARHHCQFLGLAMRVDPVSYTHLRAHATVLDVVCRLLLENKERSLA